MSCSSSFLRACNFLYYTSMARSFESSLLLINNASIAYLSSLFIRQKLKIVRCLSHISFLFTCMRFHLRPKFINFELCAPKCSTTNRLSQWLIKKWLDTERRRWHANRDKASALAYLASTRLSFLLCRQTSSTVYYNYAL